MTQRPVRRLQFSKVLAILIASIPLCASAHQTAVPDWVFPLNPPQVAEAASSENTAAPQHVPGSKETFTRAQLSNLLVTPDWFPQSHTPMPEAVARGRAPGMYACGFCHLPTGQGRPENASLAGLPAAYIIQQVADFKSGVRRSALGGVYLPTELMAHIAAVATTEEVASAAEYFSQQHLSPRVRVVERPTVPRSRVIGWVYAGIPGGGEEPLGQRLMEFAPDPVRHENRDDTMRYIAYVPPGSVRRGLSIATNGSNGLAVACVSCHGAELKGVGLVPQLAGRSPSYLLRQLLAFQTGARAGATGLPMGAVVAKLPIGSMIDVAAYAASLPP